VEEINELKREGLSIQAISQLTGFDRKTIRKYLLKPEGRPVYGPRSAPESKLEPFKHICRNGFRPVSGMRKCCCVNCGSVITTAATRS
jgi:transposase